MKKALTSLAAATALAVAGGSFAAVAAKGPGHHGHSRQSGNGYGWGWDSVYGFYVGPIFGHRGVSYRCFAPGYGWRPCPHS